MGIISAAARNALPAKDFGLPAQGKWEMCT